MGEEIALPNSVVLANVTRNYSRATAGSGFVLDTTITIGYDTPWRPVHAMLLEVASAIAEISPEPAPYVVQTALSDFYVAYKLVVYVGAETPAVRASHERSVRVDTGHVQQVRSADHVTALR